MITYNERLKAELMTINDFNEFCKKSPKIHIVQPVLSRTKTYDFGERLQSIVNRTENEYSIFVVYETFAK